MPLTVKKDFLEEPVFEQIKNIILSNNFNWFFQNEQNKLAKDGFFFSHKLYAEDRIESDFFNFIIPHLKKRHLLKRKALKFLLVLMTTV